MADREKKKLPAPLDDVFARKQTKFSCPADLFAEETGSQHLLPEDDSEFGKVLCHLSFEADPHIAFIEIALSQKVREFVIGGEQIHRLAKIKIPGKALVSFEPKKVQPQDLVNNGVWTHAEANASKISKGRFLWGVKITFMLAMCAIQNIRSAAVPASLSRLSSHLGGGTRELGTHTLYLVCRAGDKDLENWDRLESMFEASADEDPLKKWYPKLQRYQVNVGKMPPLYSMPDYQTASVYSFFPGGDSGFDDYLTRMAYGMHMEHCHISDTLTPADWKTGTITLLQSIGLGERQFFGLIKREDSDNSVRFSEGDTIEVDLGFGETKRVGTVADIYADTSMAAANPDEGELWTAVVCSPLPFAPNGYLTILVNRPWDKVSGTWKHEIKHLPIIPYTELASQEATIAAVHSAVPFSVSFRSQETDRVYKRDMAAIEQMFKLHQEYVRKSDGFVYKPSYFQVLDKLVLNNNATDAIKTIDLYAPVRNEIGDGDIAMATGMKLEGDQKLVVEQMEKAVGGWVLVQGPPGTGKTYIAIEVIVPFLASPENHQILLASATNTGADDLALKAHAKLEALQKEGNGKGKFVVRVHSLATEKVITLRDGKGARKIPEGARPKSYDIDSENVDPNVLAELETALVMHNRYQSIVGRKHRGIRDRRVQQVFLSVGYRMNQVLGLIDTDFELLPQRYSTNEKGRTIDKYSGAKGYYLQYMDNEAFDDEKMANFGKELQTLREDLLSAATVVACTVSAAGSHFVHEHVTPHIWVVDEAARVMEPDLIPLSAYYPSTQGKILIGDIFQLKPLIHSVNAKVRNFASQLRLTTMHRLQQTDFGIVFLNTQFRMDPDVAAITSTIVYNNKVSNHASVQDRPLRFKLQEFNQKQFNRNCHVLYTDIQNGVAHSNDSGSQFNEVFCGFSVNLVEALLKEDFMHDEKMGKEGKPTLAVLTPYQAQSLYYNAAFDKMILKSIPGVEQVSFDKVDSRQGWEFDIVIVDLTITNRLGFMGDVGRLNVLFSRARTGLYVVGNKDAMDKIPDEGKLWLRQFHSSILRYRQEITDTTYSSELVDFSKVDVGEAVDMEGQNVGCDEAPMNDEETTGDETTLATSSTPWEAVETVPTNLAGTESWETAGVSAPTNPPGKESWETVGVSAPTNPPGKESWETIGVSVPTNSAGTESWETAGVSTSTNPASKESWEKVGVSTPLPVAPDDPWDSEPTIPKINVGGVDATSEDLNLPTTSNPASTMVTDQPLEIEDLGTTSDEQGFEPGIIPTQLLQTTDSFEVNDESDYESADGLGMDG